MITVEEKQALESEINTAKEQIRVLQEELVAKQRYLWWAKRPHIAEFDNGYQMQSDDEGGGYAEWEPEGVVLSKKWLAQEGNQGLVDIALKNIEDEDHSGCAENYLICGLEPETEYYFCEDPYPGFHDWSLKTVRNPNYV